MLVVLEFKTSKIETNMQLTFLIYMGGKCHQTYVLLIKYEVFIIFLLVISDLKIVTFMNIFYFEVFRFFIWLFDLWSSMDMTTYVGKFKCKSGKTQNFLTFGLHDSLKMEK